jgi:hypothetical protein
VAPADVAGDVADSYWLMVVESHGDTWHIISEWKGATWPNEGLPHGTHLLVVGLWLVYQNFYGSVGFDSRTSLHL